MGRRLAIPDIHGCAMTFGVLVDEVIKLKKDDVLYILGDMVDRGPDSKAVLDRIMRMLDAGYDIQCVPGNHDDWFVSWYRGLLNLDSFCNWTMHGGSETLKSFQAEKPSHVDEKYINFLDGLPFHIELDDYVLVHGGLNLFFKDPVGSTSPVEKLWSGPFGGPWYGPGAHEWPLKGKKLLVGHTSVTVNDIRESIDKNRHVIKLDNGCVFKHDMQKGYGNLVCFDLDSKKLYVQPNIDIPFGY